jgi:hypothetical protein
LVVVATAILVMAMAAAGSVQASNPNTVTAVNKISADINQSLNIEFRFSPGTLHIQHGATLTFREGPPQPPFAFEEGVDPHTLSIVRQADLPRTLRELVECEVCGPINAAHDPGNDGEPPFVYRVNKGGPGLDVAGDSWMQGKLVVE